MSRVIHFEVVADDPQSASEFYGAVFGWGVNRWDGPAGYWLLTTGQDDEPGINGAIMHSADMGKGTWNTVSVASIEDSARKIAKAGGEIVSERTTIPGVGYHLYCKDTEGNVFGILEADKAAGHV